MTRPSLMRPCARDRRCVYGDGHGGPHGYPPPEDRSYADAVRDINWRLVGEAPVSDLGPCSCGEERVDPVADGFRCISCGTVR